MHIKQKVVKYQHNLTKISVLNFIYHVVNYRLRVISYKFTVFPIYPLAPII
ncbi:protein of unknown function [Moritella yayanosii]|uniref:Uncharacterized protein n=1 Tax=Moritella yayanosii TaxID=69539 RepID=A0A330LQL6_9GAMM|nr:protein of unknown function [Moritella yayanosii]